MLASEANNVKPYYGPAFGPLYRAVEGRVRLSTGGRTMPEGGPAKRLRALVIERSHKARVEGEGVEKPKVVVEAETAAAAADTPTTSGESRSI